MDERQEVIGYLTDDGVLYCSRECPGAKKRAGREVDQDEYEALVEGGGLVPESVCPGCGAEFSVQWPEDEMA